MTYFIGIAIWEFFCYGFYLKMQDEVLSGRNPHNAYDLSKVEKTKEQLVKESMVLGAVCLALAISPLFFLL